MAPRALGRIPPTDDVHEQKYPLTASTTPRTPTPVVLGTNWYTGMDTTRDVNGRHWIEVSGRVRGGHAYCLMPRTMEDSIGWWDYYNQGEEGACVSFASNRMMSLLNRNRYEPWLAYKWMQANDEFTTTPPDPGTSVRTGMDFLRTLGPYRVRGGKPVEPLLDHGISENRWCKTVEQIASCLDPGTDGERTLKMGYVIVLNSWGRSYPHYSRMSLETLNRLVIEEEGEATLVTDRTQ